MKFAAYHLDLGASEIHIYLDDPDPSVETFFADTPQVRLTQCGPKRWARVAEHRRQTHQQRQALNATRAYRHASVDWLAHIDVDEFLLAPTPITDILRALPPEVSHARMRPAELLAQPDPYQGPSHFKLTRPEGDRSKTALVDIYGDVGAYLAEGFLGYVGGKIIARTGRTGLRFGIHTVKQDGASLPTGVTLPDLRVGHAHAPSYAQFQKHLEFRLKHGSYRRRTDEVLRMEDIVTLVLDEDGEAGLRRFYDQVNAASPALLSKLETHGMLLTASLDLDEKVERWFGPMPGDT